jgi:UDP-N-acetylmuramate dehydrogenase
LGIGGEIKNLLRPRCEEELVSMLRGLNPGEGPFCVIGGGSNVLMTDDAFDAPLVLTTAMNGVEVERRGSGTVLVRCGAGVRLADLFAMTLEEGWGGLEFASGIPGTVGGAVMGNAGTLHGETGQAVRSVRMIGAGGAVRDFSGGGIEWGYRSCGLADEFYGVVSEVTFSFRELEKEAVLEKARRSADSRRNQPRGRMTAGCVFRNPPGGSAGRLLELAGCKGLSSGGAAVSEVHANFIENPGGATARDFARLALICRDRVLELFGVRLQFEIRTLGISLGD